MNISRRFRLTLVYSFATPSSNISLREEEARGNGTNTEIMGFIDTVLITKIVDRLARQGPKDRPVTLPKWLHGSLAGSKTFNETMKSGGAQLARVAASERTRIVDEQESDEDEMQIPVIP